MKPRTTEQMKYAPPQVPPEVPKPEVQDNFNLLVYKTLEEFPPGKLLLTELVKREVLKPMFPAVPNAMEQFGGAQGYAMFFEGRKSVIRALQECINQYRHQPPPQEELNATE